MDERLSNICRLYSKIDRRNLDQVITVLFKPLVEYYDWRCDSEVEYDYIQDTVENILMSLTRYERVNFRRYIDRNYHNMIKEYKPLNHEEIDLRVLKQDFETGDFLIKNKLIQTLKEIYSNNIKCINNKKYNILVFIGLLLATTDEEVLTSRIFNTPRDEYYLNYIKYIAYSKIKELRSEVNI